MGGNPILYNDPDGRWFGLDDLAAAAIGGVINLASNANQGNVHGFGSALSYLGVGALSGEATLYGGPLAGGAVMGLGGSLVSQVAANGWANINYGRLATSTALGAATAWAVGQIIDGYTSDGSSTGEDVTPSSSENDPDPINSVNGPSNPNSYTTGGTVGGTSSAVSPVGSDPFNDVANYISNYGELPPAYITKADALSLGWQPKLGNLDLVAPGQNVGGDVFRNSEGLLPTSLGRTWFEAEINYAGGFRGAERLLYSNDGLFLRL